MPLTMPSFLRRPSSPAVEEVEPEEPAEVRRRGYTPSKKELGQSTPKRKGGPRVIAAAPADTKEARKAARDRAREARAVARAGMMAGEEEYLQPRDKGPERRLVRNLVDARRNAGGFFMPSAFVLILFTSEAWPAQVRLAVNIIWVIMLVGLVVDSYVLTRRIRAVVQERFPKSKERLRSLYWYGIMRSINFRGLRIPKPQVKHGEAI